MEAETKQKIQIVLAVLLLIAAARTAYIFYERRQSEESATSREAPGTIHNVLTGDDYVHERAFLGHDLASTRRHLKGTTAWMKAGNYYTYYPYNAGTRSVDLKRELGVVPPLEKMEITDVVLTPGTRGRQMMAVFRRPQANDGKLYAVPIGAERNGDYRVLVPDILFRQEPRELYKHWPAEAWAAIDRHEAITGMSERQVWFALGVGIPQDVSAPAGSRTIEYHPPGKTVQVRFVEDRAVEIKELAALTNP